MNQFSKKYRNFNFNYYDIYKKQYLKLSILKVEFEIYLRMLKFDICILLAP